jgi:hypothetical protein
MKSHNEKQPLRDAKSNPKTNKPQPVSQLFKSPSDKNTMVDPKLLESFNNALPMLLKKYGEQSEFIEMVFNEIKNAGFQGYSSLNELDIDIASRALTVSLMNDVNSDDRDDYFEYPDSISRFGVRDASHWITRPLKIIKVEGSTAMDAMAELFRHGAYLDCERTADACVIGGISLAFKLNNMEEEFNHIFKTKPLEFKHLGWQKNKPFSEFPVEMVNMDKTILPGDRVYFANLPEYKDYNKAAYTNSSGEHAIYMGNGKFQGFGVSLVSYEQMVRFLAERIDENNAGFENFLFEKFNSSQFKNWEQVMPNVRPEHMLQFKKSCEIDFKSYLAKISPKTVSKDNLPAHLKDICALRLESLTAQVRQYNNQEQYRLARRIDMTALLKLHSIKLTNQTHTSKLKG